MERTAQVPLRPRCPDHKKILFACGNCKNVFVCVTCATTIHSGHQLDPIASYIEKVCETIYSADEKVQECMDELLVVREQKQGNTAVTQQTIAKIEHTGKRLKRLIDDRVTEQVEICRTIEYRNKDVLSTLENSLSNFIKDIPVLVNKAKDDNINQEETDIALWRLDSVKSLCQLMEDRFREIRCAERNTDPVSFEPPEIHCKDLNTLDKLFGFVKTDDLDVSQRKVEFSGRSFDLDVTISSIQSARDEMAWLIDEGTDVKRVTASGVVKDSVELEDYGVQDIALTKKDPKLMYLASEGNNIQSVVVGGVVAKPIFLCSTEGEPTGLCMTNDDNIAVIESIDNGGGKLKIYDRAGHVIREKCDRDKSDAAKLFSRPMKVRCNHVTGDLAVINSNPDHLVFFDKDLNFRFFLYHGRRTSSPPRTEKRGPNLSYVEKIEPYSIAFDRGGNLLVSDFNEKVLILYDMNGYFLGTLLRDLNPITALDVSEDGGTLWVGHDNGTIKTYNYS